MKVSKSFVELLDSQIQRYERLQGTAWCQDQLRVFASKTSALQELRALITPADIVED